MRVRKHWTVIADQGKRLHLTIPCNMTFKEECKCMNITFLIPCSFIVLHELGNFYTHAQELYSFTGRQMKLPNRENRLNRCRSECNERTWVTNFGAQDSIL